MDLLYNRDGFLIATTRLLWYSGGGHHFSDEFVFFFTGTFYRFRNLASVIPTTNRVPKVLVIGMHISQTLDDIGFVKAIDVVASYPCAGFTLFKPGFLKWVVTDIQSVRPARWTRKIQVWHARNRAIAWVVFQDYTRVYHLLISSTCSNNVAGAEMLSSGWGWLCFHIKYLKFTLVATYSVSLQIFGQKSFFLYYIYRTIGLIKKWFAYCWRFCTFIADHQF